MYLRLEDELKDMMDRNMPQEKVLTKEGGGRIQQVFAIRDKSSTVVAGLIVTDGTIKAQGLGIIYLSISLSKYLIIYVSIYLSIYLIGKEYVFTIKRKGIVIEEDLKSGMYFSIYVSMHLILY
jgi:hypothetical protein